MGFLKSKRQSNSEYENESPPIKGGIVYQQHETRMEENPEERLDVLDARQAVLDARDDFDVETNRHGIQFELQQQQVQAPSHLNSVFNGHMMVSPRNNANAALHFRGKLILRRQNLKLDTEEGSIFIRVPAFFGGVGLIASNIASLILEENAVSPHAIVLVICVFIMSFFVLILDGRFIASNPLSPRAHLRNIMTRNFNMLRFLWGRGMLYFTAGVLNVAQMWFWTICAGSFMVFVGIVAVVVGIRASRKFNTLRNSLADESFLLLMFNKYDYDNDGYIYPDEFALLLCELGMELDDRYTLKAFSAIDLDGDRRISFDEFSHWWAMGFIERGRKAPDDGRESYVRMP